MRIFTSDKLFHMKMRLWLVLLPFGLLINSGCQKDTDGGGTTKKTKTELISQSSWKFDRAGLDLDNNGTIDSPLPAGVLQSCDTDGTLTFKSDGTGTGDEGLTKCDAANPQTTNFNWSLKNNETVINFSNVLFGGLTGDVKLIGVTDTELTLEKDVTSGSITVNVVVVLKH
jgi:hypothetical protein